MYKRQKAIMLHLCILTTIFISVSCNKEINPIEGPDNYQNFIPQGNKKFIYDVIVDDEKKGSATQWVSDKTDSSGINVFTLNTLLETADGSMTLDNKIFTKEGKTYTELKVPEAWYQTAALLDMMPGITVTNTAIFGYPAYLTMENNIIRGSKLSLDGPLEQGQLIEYTHDGTLCSMEQTMVLLSGSSEVETIEVAAGSFVCNRYEYEFATTIKNKVGNKMYTGNGEEHITLWVAHGIGTVKQQSFNLLVTLVPLPTGEIKQVVTNTRSGTVLKEII